MIHCLSLLLLSLSSPLLAEHILPDPPISDASPLNTALRPDGKPVALLGPGEYEEQLARLAESNPPFPFRPFSEAYVKKALATPTDWRDFHAVTPAKDQGPHPFCGTFARVAAFEGQYALKSAERRLVSFSVEQLVDCIGWDRDQLSYVQEEGLMSEGDYP